MSNIAIYNSTFLPSNTERQEIIDFLHNHLDEFGDDKEDIAKSVAFAMHEGNTLGGFVITSRLDSKLAGVVVVNKTGMKGFIPENILVYIATNREMRGKGVGTELMNKAIDNADGNIALHVEPNNPARKLYEKLGFQNKYLEMRLIKNK